MSEPNPERGEHALTLGGRTYVLRPSYAAIRAIEAKAERTLAQLVLAAQAGAVSVETAGIVAAELIRAGADDADQFTKRVSADRIAELVYEEGVTTVVARLTFPLLDAVTGGRTASGEAKAVAAETTIPEATTAD